MNSPVKSSPRTTVKGTLRHQFDTEEVRSRLEDATPTELSRMLDEALNVIDGLRQVLVTTQRRADLISDAVIDSQWMGHLAPPPQIAAIVKPHKWKRN